MSVIANAPRAVCGRAYELFSVASDLAKMPIEALLKGRRYPTIGWRYAVFYKMREEGYSLHEIERHTGYSHCAVYHGALHMAEALKANTDRWFKQMYLDLTAADIGGPVDVIRTTDTLIKRWLHRNGVSAELAERQIGRAHV